MALRYSTSTIARRFAAHRFVARLNACILVLVASFALSGCFQAVPLTAPDASVPDGVREITVNTGLEGDAAYRALADAFQSAGFAIQSSDPLLGSITTTVREFSASDTPLRTGYRMQLSGRAHEEEVVLTGTYITNTFGEQAIRKAGRMNTVPRRAWERMYEVAASLADTTQPGQGMSFAQ